MEKWRRRVRAEASGGDEAKASLAIAPPRRRFWVDKRKWFTLLPKRKAMFVWSGNLN